MGTFTNSEDSDEMPHTNSEYPSGSTLFAKVKKIFRQKKTILFEKIYTDTPRPYNGPSQAYGIKPEGRIH